MSIANKVLYVCILLSVLFHSPIALSQQLQLKIAGDPQSGFYVNVYDGNQMLVTNSEEFSIDLFNTDLSTHASIKWKGQTWTGNDKSITLLRDSYVKEFDANLSVKVMYTYQIVGNAEIKRTGKIKYRNTVPLI
jgi:hypothetical protein